MLWAFLPIILAAISDATSEEDAETRLTVMKALLPTDPTFGVPLYIWPDGARIERLITTDQARVIEDRVNDGNKVEDSRDNPETISGGVLVYRDPNGAFKGAWTFLIEDEDFPNDFFVTIWSDYGGDEYVSTYWDERIEDPMAARRLWLFSELASKFDGKLSFNNYAVDRNQFIRGLIVVPERTLEMLHAMRAAYEAEGKSDKERSDLWKAFWELHRENEAGNFDAQSLNTYFDAAMEAHSARNNIEYLQEAWFRAGDTWADSPYQEHMESSDQIDEVLGSSENIEAFWEGAPVPDLQDWEPEHWKRLDEFAQVKPEEVAEGQYSIEMEWSGMWSEEGLLMKELEALSFPSHEVVEPSSQWKREIRSEWNNDEDFEVEVNADSRGPGWDYQWTAKDDTGERSGSSTLSALDALDNAEFLTTDSQERETAGIPAWEMPDAPESLEQLLHEKIYLPPWAMPLDEFVNWADEQGLLHPDVRRHFGLLL